VAETPTQKALRLVLAMFDPGVVERAEIVDNCQLVLEMLERKGTELPDLELLIKEVESRVVVWQERSTSLEDRTGHQEWLPTARQDQEWRFWDRYRRYLEQVALLPPAVISRIDDSTDRVLSRLESPHRPGEWDRRGLVVGQVQSGKTAHYTGLVCKAADAGYKLIVVLAGMHNSLRSQTQLRLDEGLLGFDSQYQHRYDAQTQSRMGVGLMPGAEALKSGSLTTSIESGDFKKSRARNLALPIGDMPVLLVIKKHGGILGNLIRWITQMHGLPVSPGSSELVVQDVPLLVIDDEADNASVNTKSRGEDPTVINRRIRGLLKAFDRSSYVGYTATPFANIFSSTVEDEDHGLDLFPRHFIESLKPPSNYFGPVRVFGLPAREEHGAGLEPLPIFREIEDHTDWMPDRHRVSWRPSGDRFPYSLRLALLSFLLVCAARRQRGHQTGHNSMLIHTTRFTNVQRQVAEQVEDLLTSLRYRLRYGDGDALSVWDELGQLWSTDFVPTSATWSGDAAVPVTWDEIRPHVRPAVDKVVVKTINGTSAEALSYYENRDNGLSVIAIGGDKLSRGLTLEGLSISYYLRASRMYDTLMQMGRWFGYRPGYEDLCRLYTTLELKDWYAEITAASEELRADFDDMAARNGTPEDYGLRVRQSPAGLSVTSPTKMRSATTVTLTFSGDISETVTFNTEEKDLAENWSTLESFIRSLRTQEGAPEIANNGNYVWTGVPGVVVVDDFFQHYKAERMARRARPELIRSYITDGIEAGELVDWTVVLVNNLQTDQKEQIDGLDVGLTRRSPLDARVERGRYRIRRLLSPSDELTDLSDEQRQRGLEEMARPLREQATDQRPFVPPKDLTGPVLRRQRPPHKALLLIYPLTLGPGHEALARPAVGFATSFPFSERIQPRTYRVNQIWTLLAFDDLEDEPDDQ
jgi:hypothetical protein